MRSAQLGRTTAPLIVTSACIRKKILVVGNHDCFPTIVFEELKILKYCKSILVGGLYSH